MKTCEMKDRCDFFKDLVPEMPEMSPVLKNYFCRENKTECARYKLFKMIGNLDQNTQLLPNQEDYPGNQLFLSEFF